MTATQPTGNLWTDIAIFGVFFLLAFLGVAFDSARRVKRGRW
jgi:hypothetical protein